MFSEKGLHGTWPRVSSEQLSRRLEEPMKTQNLPRKLRMPSEHSIHYLYYSDQKSLQAVCLNWSFKFNIRGLAITMYGNISGVCSRLYIRCLALCFHNTNHLTIGLGCPSFNVEQTPTFDSRPILVT